MSPRAVARISGSLRIATLPHAFIIPFFALGVQLLRCINTCDGNDVEATTQMCDETGDWPGEIMLKVRGDIEDCKVRAVAMEAASGLAYHVTFEASGSLVPGRPCRSPGRSGNFGRVADGKRANMVLSASAESGGRSVHSTHFWTP